MAAASNIVLPDGLATPVNHTFVPVEKDKNGVFWFEDQSLASPIGYYRIGVSLVRPSAGTAGDSSQNRVNRVRLTISTPKLENVTNSTVSGVAPAPTLSYVPRASVEFVLPERSATQDRKDLRLFVSGLMSNTHLINAVESLQGIW